MIVYHLLEEWVLPLIQEMIVYHLFIQGIGVYPLFMEWLFTPYSWNVIFMT